MDRKTPLNEASAADAVAAIDEPVTKNLVALAVAHARMQFMKEVGKTDEELERRLPDAPFDMQFYVRVLAQAFARPAVIRSILDGKSIAESTGWDFE